MTSRPQGPLVVVGDALLDIDLDGTATRLAPDAPVPVLDDLAERARPGGAGLAALMAARDGHDVVLVTAVGDDGAGERLTGLLRDEGVAVRRLPYDGPTAVKQRVRADGRPMLRLDSGSTPGPIADTAEALDDALVDAAGVLVADYGRGVAALPAIRRRLEELPQRVPVVWDPHSRGGPPVPGVRLATPNRAEALGFAQRSADVTTLAGVRAAAETLVRAWRAQAVTVTLGAGGALLTYGEGMPVVVPAPEVASLDPCGAGDRFAVTAALCLASGAVTAEAVHEAVADAARYVGGGGPATLETSPPSDATGGGGAHRDVEALVGAVSSRGGTVVATGGCFDLLHAGHVATLRAARRLGDCLVVCLNSDDSVRRLKGPSRPLVPAADRARVLEALEPVDAVVVFDEDTPVEVLRRLRPDVWAKGGDYAGATVPEMAVLEEWGGQAVVLPYLQGRSTTRLLDTATARTVPVPGGDGPSTKEKDD